MNRIHRINRRTFLSELGRNTVAVAVLGTGIVACSDDDDAATTTTAPDSSGSDPTSETSTTSPTTAGASSTTPATGDLQWARVPLGIVSAYVLARGDEIAVVDTGVAGSGADIEAALQPFGADLDAVDHVIVTHLHADHQGGLREVMVAAEDAAAYAGSLDVAALDSPRAVRPVDDGDEVFGLRIIGTPGHTAGHISVLDEGTGLLVAGDALNEANGEILGPNEQFTDDMSEALRSVQKLADFDFQTAVFGHGEPVETGASAQVIELANAS